MNKLIVFFIATFISIDLAFSQTESVSFHLGHDDYHNPLYVLDGLKLDSASFFKLSFDKRQIKTIVPVNPIKALKQYGEKGRNGVIEVHTKTMIILNENELTSQKDKWKYLSNLKIGKPITIKQIECEEAIKLYGKGAKYGAIQIETPLGVE